MTGKVRLLFVIENSSYGGGERSFAQLINGLDKSRYEVFCASRPSGRFYNEVKDKCVFLPLDLGCRFNVFNIGRLKALMLSNRIDIVHSQGPRADFFCGLAASLAKVKAVATVAVAVEAFDVCLPKKIIYKALYASVAGKFAMALTVSDQLREVLSGRFRSVKVVPNGVDLREFSPTNFNAGPVIEKFALRGRLVIGAVGRLEHPKGHEYLLKALALAFSRQPALRESMSCLIAGSGSLGLKLREQAAELGLEKNLVFCGELEETRDFLGAVDIFVMPSLSEGQPLALLEAMAMAKPVIASDIPGISSTAGAGKEALLVTPASPADLASAIIRLAGDIPAALALGRNARAKAAGYGLDKFIAGHEKIYSELAGG